MNGKFNAGNFEDEQQPTLGDIVYNGGAAKSAPPRRNAIVPQANGEMVYKRFTITPTGLKIPSDATVEEFEDLGNIVSSLQTKLQWVLGDWINGYMDKGFSNRDKAEAYEEIALRYNLESKTVKEYSYITRSVDASIRMDALSFGHHQLVAPDKYSRDDKYNWLMWAVQEGASIADMRKQMKGDTPTPPLTIKRINRDFAAYLQNLEELGQKGRADLRQLAYDLIMEIDQMG